MADHRMFAEIAALAGDPARAQMLLALMGGRALTATELAGVGGVAPQTASGHLARMTAAGVLAVEKQGRHRYHRLASPAVAAMLEGIMQVASEVVPPRRRGAAGPRDAALRQARSCYDHLAGRLGVALADTLVAAGHVELNGEAGLVLDSGVAFLGRLGVDLAAIPAGGAKPSRRVLCRPCLDWSERRLHLAGAVGAALFARSLAAGWVRRLDGTRAVQVTPLGTRVFRDSFGVALE